MYNKYSNFVRPSTVTTYENCQGNRLSGEEAKKLYLEEIREPKNHPCMRNSNTSNAPLQKRGDSKRTENVQISDKQLYLTVQNNDVNTLRQVLASHPDKINTIDEFGWSLLMIACQANAVDTARELLLRGSDISIRDKAGNSACSLVIKNKNYQIVDILLSHKDKSLNLHKNYVEELKVTSKVEYYCETCNRVFPDKEEHMSSTIHNIGASKGKKVTANFVIPSSNKGYQLMLKDGWDRMSGLGPDGSGKKYPIKTEQKIDKKGLGHGKRKKEKDVVPIKEKYRKVMDRHNHSDRTFEINFRRQFY